MKREEMVLYVVLYTFCRNAPQMNKMCILVWKTKSSSLSLFIFLQNGILKQVIYLCLYSYRMEDLNILFERPFVYVYACMCINIVIYTISLSRKRLRDECVE